MSRYYEKEDVSRRERDGGFYDNGGHVGGGAADDYVRESLTVLPPPNASRPRSMPPDPNAALIRREQTFSRSISRSSSRSSSRSRDGDRGASRSRSRARTPLAQARNIVEDNFTSSTAGIGASILGAVVGGFVANRASGALQQRHRRRSGSGHRRNSDEANVPRIASTVLGAVVGGLGANALTNRLEDNRERQHTSRGRWEDWERRHVRDDERPPHLQNNYRNDRFTGRGRDEDEYDFVYDEKIERRRRSNDSHFRP